MTAKVCLVLELIDDYSNRLIREHGIRVSISNEKPPLKKADGYYVFTNLTGREVTVQIESGIYEKKSVTVDLTQSPDSYPMLKVRLIPNVCYPLPAGTTCLEGQAEPDSAIRIVCREPDRSMKLLADYNCEGESADEILIYHPPSIDIEGKTLFIENRNETEKEFFRILKQVGDNRYRLLQRLGGSYKKIGTVIYLVYSGVTNEKSYFFIPMGNTGKEKQNFFCEAAGAVTVQRECELITGNRNRLDLRKEWM